MANIFRAFGSSRKILADPTAIYYRLSRYNPNGKRFIAKTVPKPKCPSDKDKCFESSSSSMKNHCSSISDTKKDDVSAATSASKNLCGKTAETSSEHCAASLTNSRIDREATRYCKSTVDDPCSRDCKISSPPVCGGNSCSKEEVCPEPPPDICPPTEEIEKKAKFWRNATLFVALPIVFLSSIIIGRRAKEEARNPRPEFVPMDYLYIRTKRFPWGDGNHGFFHNPERNAVPPDGYEVEDPNAIVKKE